ncbi:MAG: Maf family protein, partial [Planctomycetes bacterium]|nr:Maf family protein [Planctomycetota bacterium]
IQTSHREERVISKTDVTFRNLGDAEIGRYLDSDEPYDKAGAYGIQTRGHDLVASIRGCYLNIVGLPVMLMCEMLGVETSYRCPCADHQLQTCASGCKLGAACGEQAND